MPPLAIEEKLFYGHTRVRFVKKLIKWGKRDHDLNSLTHVGGGDAWLRCNNIMLLGDI